MAKKFIKKFTPFDLVVIAMMAALGVAIKPFVVPLAHIITGPLFIPGGVIAGGFYMMWIVLGASLVGKTGTGILIAVVQAIMVVAGGVFGTHGIVSFITYIAPGIMVDMVFLISGRHKYSLGSCFFAGIAANISGSFLVNMVFFRLPVVPLMLSLSCAAISGGIGGIISHKISIKLRNFNLINEKL